MENHIVRIVGMNIILIVVAVMSDILEMMSIISKVMVIIVIVVLMIMVLYAKAVVSHVILKMALIKVQVMRVKKNLSHIWLAHEDAMSVTVSMFSIVLNLTSTTIQIYLII